MNYKGYTAEVKFDEDAEIFFGSVIGTKDTITFQSESSHELKKEFQLSVDDYLEFCKEEGVCPDKPYSGRFNVRLQPELHRKLSITARQRHKSINDVVVETLEHSLV